MAPPTNREEDSDSSDGSVRHAGHCEDDRCRGEVFPVFHCVDCDSSYCSECWPLQGPHKPKKKGRDGVPHEKADPAIVSRLYGILNPSRELTEIKRLHAEDEATKWFGVSKDSTGQPTFDDFGRYTSLMSQISDRDDVGPRYPQIVSFIGTTNAGKSTLIKLLVDHEAEGNAIPNRERFPSPVVGSVINDALPTSGDVHLYADPSTHAERFPLLYADCEGFDGGERIPLGARERSDNASDTERARSRAIHWANTEETQQREFAVTALYPRLLYTFSDCVVFVLRNPKTFQSRVLANLLDWGAAALEKSINQPALPHCIVALNGSDPSVNEPEWDTEYATQSLLSTVRGALDNFEGVPRFRQLAAHWRSLGKEINNIADLIMQYYSSFQVVRIPARPRYMTMNEQVGKLHTLIKKNCDEAYRAKRRARMLVNADELNVYLQSGFDHFTLHLNRPFNFMEISLLRNPIPNDFGGHILQLCTTITSTQTDLTSNAIVSLFEHISVMLSSCVLLDCSRFRKGQVDQLFKEYEKFFDYALSEYLEMHCPCGFVNPDDKRKCKVIKARHTAKGHQDCNGIIAIGDYQEPFNKLFETNWKQQLRTAIDKMHHQFSSQIQQTSFAEDDDMSAEDKIAMELHTATMGHFFTLIGPAETIRSHRTCFCCLMDMPEHVLPCGHVLCTACVKGYGKKVRPGVELKGCPLHEESTRWKEPVLIKFKPAGAGVRILALDGGGIRGVVQLESLRAIEVMMGSHVPVQKFFDLIVGTGTGGMIAASLAEKGRTVESCLDMLTAVCDHAFAPRLRGIPVVPSLIQAIGNGRKFKTKPLHSALKTAFTEDNRLFGLNNNFDDTGPRVGLTATSATGLESVVLANYRRPDDVSASYAFQRPHEPGKEIKIWESIAAALSSPRLFKPFDFNTQTLLDGALRFVNPSYIADCERRLIWPDVVEPDVFLSLGTGQYRMVIKDKLARRANDAAVAKPLPKGAPSIIEEGRKASSKWMLRKTDDIFDAEVMWTDFRDSAEYNEDWKGRKLLRFNPDLQREPPALDSKSNLRAVREATRTHYRLDHSRTATRWMAHKLIASSFYLDVQSRTVDPSGERMCEGEIMCRFDEGGSEVMGLGKMIMDRWGSEFTPYFLVQPEAKSNRNEFKVPIDRGMTDYMVAKGVFFVQPFYIPLADETQPSMISLMITSREGIEPGGFSISGFPRNIWKADSVPRPRGASSATTGTTLRNVSTISGTTQKDSTGDISSLRGGSLKGKMRASDELIKPETPRTPSIMSTQHPTPLPTPTIPSQVPTPPVPYRPNAFGRYIREHQEAQKAGNYNHGPGYDTLTQGESMRATNPHAKPLEDSGRSVSDANTPVARWVNPMLEQFPKPPFSPAVSPPPPSIKQKQFLPALIKQKQCLPSFKFPFTDEQPVPAPRMRPTPASQPQIFHVGDQRRMSPAGPASLHNDRVRMKASYAQQLLPAPSPPPTKPLPVPTPPPSQASASSSDRPTTPDPRWAHMGERYNPYPLYPNTKLPTTSGIKTGRNASPRDTPPPPPRRAKTPVSPLSIPATSPPSAPISPQTLSSPIALEDDLISDLDPDDYDDGVPYSPHSPHSPHSLHSPSTKSKNSAHDSRFASTDDVRPPPRSSVKSKGKSARAESPPFPHDQVRFTSRERRNMTPLELRRKRAD